MSHVLSFSGQPNKFSCPHMQISLIGIPCTAPLMVASLEVISYLDFLTFSIFKKKNFLLQLHPLRINNTRPPSYELPAFLNISWNMQLVVLSLHRRPSNLKGWDHGKLPAERAIWPNEEAHLWGFRDFNRDGQWHNQLLCYSWIVCSLINFCGYGGLHCRQIHSYEMMGQSAKEKLHHSKRHLWVSGNKNTSWCSFEHILYFRSQTERIAETFFHDSLLSSHKIDQTIDRVCWGIPGMQ